MSAGETAPTTLGEALTAISVKSMPLPAFLTTFLQEHGCTCQGFECYVLVVLPQGSIKQEMFPRMPITDRFLTTLPDGTQFIESYDRYRKLSVVLSIMPGNEKQ
jgi:hypothetical protein